MGERGGYEERCETPGVSRLYQLDWTRDMLERMPLMRAKGICQKMGERKYVTHGDQAASCWK